MAAISRMSTRSGWTAPTRVVRRLEDARPIAHGAGERAADVAEQLAGQQSFGLGSAVEWKKRQRLSVAQLVDRARHQLLAGARLPDDQDRSAGGGDAPDGGEDLPHRLARAQQAAGSDASLFLCLQPRAPSQQLLDARQQRIVLHGLRDEVVGAQSHGFHGRVDGPIAADHQDRYVLAGSPQRFEDAEPVGSRHPEIEKHEIDSAALQRFDAGLAVGHGQDLIAVVLEQRPRRGAKCLVVVDHQQRRLRHYSPLQPRSPGRRRTPAARERRLRRSTSAARPRSGHRDCARSPRRRTDPDRRLAHPTSW